MTRPDTSKTTPHTRSAPHTSPEQAGDDATAAAVDRVFRAAAVTGVLHAVDIDTGRELCVGADEPVVLASVFKVPLLVAFHRRAATGGVDPTTRVTLSPEERCPGGTGTSILLDDVTMSLRDFAALMITVSDNAAADVVFAHTGAAALEETTSALELPATRIVGDARALHESLLTDTDAADLSQVWSRLAQPGVQERVRALDPARTTCGTPREMTRLLALIWRDEATTPQGCAQIRRMLGLQVWPHRLASGFPYDDVVVSGKTGTLPTIRNEIGVVEYPDGGRYAVAVFTRSATLAALSPPADAAIGTAARLAVQRLRTPR